MDQLGTEIPANTLGDLPYQHNKCYLWYDGPKIWETVDIETRPIIIYCVDQEIKEPGLTIERFLVIPTTSSLIKMMITNKIDLQCFIRESSQTIYIQDTIYKKNQDPESTLYKIRVVDLPEKYFPNEGVKLYAE